MRNSRHGTKNSPAIDGLAVVLILFKTSGKITRVEVRESVSDSSAKRMNWH